MSRLDEARRGWGAVFDAIRKACDLVNSAWYEVEDKQALKAEDIHRLRNLIRYTQKVIDSWETNGKP